MKKGGSRLVEAYRRSRPHEGAFVVQRRMSAPESLGGFRRGRDMMRPELAPPPIRVKPSKV